MQGVKKVKIDVEAIYRDIVKASDKDAIADMIPYYTRRAIVMKKLSAQGVGYKSLAYTFGISESVVRKVLKRNLNKNLSKK